MPLNPGTSALTATAERYRAIFASMAEGVVFQNTDGSIEACNESAGRILGLTADQMAGRTSVDPRWAAVHEDGSSFPGETHPSMVTLRTGESLSNVVMGVHKPDGSLTWISINSRPLVRDGRQPYAVVTTFADITERKQLADALRIGEQERAQAALRKSEEQLHSLFENMNQGAAYCKMLFDGAEPQDFIYEAVNSAFEQLTGLKEVVGKKVSEVIPCIRETSPELFAIYGRVARTGVPERFESFVEALGIWFSVSVYSPQGGHFVAVFDNITERRRAEEALRESTEQLRLFVEHTPAPIAMFDQQMRYLAHSRRWIADYGLADHDLIGRSHYDVFPEISELWKERHKHCLSGAVEKCDEDPFPRANGKLDWIRWEIHPWRNGRGEIGGIIIFSENITDRKRIEDQLRHAQKLESVGRLAGGVAHDFNNLLTVINGYASFLLEKLHAHDPLRQYADEICKAGERAANLTKQLLAFSRKQVIQPRVMDLNAAIRDTVPMLERLIGEDVKLKAALDASLAHVLADPDQIHQVVLNIMVNARDAMPDGGTIEISTANVDLDEDGSAAIDPEATSGPYVVMTVTDTGHGMDEATRNRIFEPFFTTKEGGKGTGLGLAMVFGIVRQSGGCIAVSSAVGVGTSFQIYLPRQQGVCPQQEEITGASAKNGFETILLAEDQAAVRSFTKAVLSKHGYHVIEVSSGEEALEVAEGHPGPIHMLISDVVLTGMNGKVLSERLRASRPNLRAIFISGYTQDLIGQRGVLDHGTALLQKPFSPDHLATKVREILDKPLRPFD